MFEPIKMRARTDPTHAPRTALALFALAGCAMAPAEDQGDEKPTGTVSSAWTIPDPSALNDVPATAVPTGYGRYCSVVDHGGWAFTWSGPAGDPCNDLARIVGPKTVVARAGLWAMNGNNYAMVRCDGGIIYYGRVYGESALNDIFNNVNGLRGAYNCIFTISPARLQVWGPPYSPDATVHGASVFDYHVPGAPPMNIADFGMSGGDANACAVDRAGYEKASCASPYTPPPNQPAPQPPSYSAFESAYDWGLDRDTPLLAVADGIVRGSQQRVVWPLCGKFADGTPRQSLPYSPQLELFLETQVGVGEYAEHVVAAYHHMDANPKGRLAAVKTAEWGGSLPPVGTAVKKGDVIGFVGQSGCSSGAAPGDTSYHLDFMAMRLTNLTGGRAYAFKPLLSEYDSNNQLIFGGGGSNGRPGQMDPFGWAAPAGVDPLSYSLIGVGPSTDQDPSVSDQGTFSINLWDIPAFLLLPHNPGVFW